MSVPDKLHELVDRFQYHIADYKSGKYNETQVRRDFIDPLFGLLGWDIDNKEGNAEAYRDVIHEDSIKIGGATKAPDYCFRVGGTRKFFLEAKKPSIHIKEDVAASFQLRRYGWSARLPTCNAGSTPRTRRSTAWFTSFTISPKKKSKLWKKARSNPQALFILEKQKV